MVARCPPPMKVFVSYAWGPAAPLAKEIQTFFSNRGVPADIDLLDTNQQKMVEKGLLGWTKDVIANAELIIILWDDEYKRRSEMPLMDAKGNGVSVEEWFNSTDVGEKRKKSWVTVEYMLILERLKTKKHGVSPLVCFTTSMSKEERNRYADQQLSSALHACLYKPYPVFDGADAHRSSLLQKLLRYAQRARGPVFLEDEKKASATAGQVAPSPDRNRLISVVLRVIRGKLDWKRVAILLVLLELWRRLNPIGVLLRWMAGVRLLRSMARQ